VAIGSAVPNSSGTSKYNRNAGRFASQSVVDVNNVTWTSAIDHAGGNVYWFNEMTNVTTFTPPEPAQTSGIEATIISRFFSCRREGGS
jgi:hypothetical protein